MTDRYAVFGNPVAHSKSPYIHSSFARETGQQLTYEAIEAPVGGFAGAVDAFRRANGKGINITTPFKLDAYEYATDRTERARLAHASNCIKFDGDRAYAENFDGVGLVNDIVHNLGMPLGGRRVLMLGAGGAARGALLPFLAQRPAVLTVVNRDLAKTHALLRDANAAASVRVANYGELHDERFEVVVNATSASLAGLVLPLPPGLYAPRALAYDMVYGDRPTTFLEQARAAGAATLVDGLGMLVAQAAESFLLWRGVRPDTAPVIELLRAS